MPGIVMTEDAACHTIPQKLDFVNFLCLKINP